MNEAEAQSALLLDSAYLLQVARDAVERVNLCIAKGAK
jgi:hypothetical protein